MRFGHWLLSGVLRDEATGEGEGGGGGAETPDIAALQAEIDRLKTENAEKENGIRYWHEEAKKAKSGTPAKPPKQEAASGEDEEDPIELLSKEGVKGLDKLLAKRGFVRAEDVDSRVNAKAAQIATENELAVTYPDLKDTTSEFFKATAVEYKQLTDAGVPQHLAMKLAAQQAELKGYQSGKRLTPKQRQEREERAAAQDGGKSKKQATPEEDSIELDDFQKYICEQLEVKPEDYIRRAKEGVRMGGSSKR